MVSGRLLSHQYICTSRHHHYDFDAWMLHMSWSQSQHDLPLYRLGIMVEDFKFAFNAWCLLRLCCFYGTAHPSILSLLSHVTPTMHIGHRGNRLFYLHCNVGTGIQRGFRSASVPPDPTRRRVALLPEHPLAVPLDTFNWNSIPEVGVDLVLGMENGMSKACSDSCDTYLSIPQFGSIGSLSMLSALSIAMHAAHTSYRGIANPSLSPIPRNATCDLEKDTDLASRTFRCQRPHHSSLLGLDDHAILHLLQHRRQQYKLQIGILWHNDCADRNIGAVMRNANAYNCDRFLILNRKKFSKRGAVGTMNYLSTVFADELEAVRSHLEGFDLWMLHPYFPNLNSHVHELASDSKFLNDFNAHPERFKVSKGGSIVPTDAPSFYRFEDATLQDWLRSNREVNPALHPMYREMESSLRPAVHFDDWGSVFSAVSQVHQRSLRGVMLVVPEEGATPQWHLLRECSRVAYVVHPSRLCHEIQRGLTPAMSTAIALYNLRLAINAL